MVSGDGVISASSPAGGAMSPGGGAVNEKSAAAKTSVDYEHGRSSPRTPLAALPPTQPPAADKPVAPEREALPQQGTVLPRELAEAAYAGDGAAVRAWLNDQGGMVDARCPSRNSTTLLMAAAEGGKLGIVRKLLKSGATVDLQCSNGLTALSYATDQGEDSVAEALMEAQVEAR